MAVEGINGTQLVMALVDVLDREGLVTLESGLYDASSAAWDRWYELNVSGDDYGRKGQELRWYARRSLELRDLAEYVGGVVNAHTVPVSVAPLVEAVV